MWNLKIIAGLIIVSLSLLASTIFLTKNYFRVKANLDYIANKTTAISKIDVSNGDKVKKELKAADERFDNNVYLLSDIEDQKNIDVGVACKQKNNVQCVTKTDKNKLKLIGDF